MNNDEWVYQYPIGKFVERQGWKIHISSEYNSSHELLQDVAKFAMKCEFHLNILVQKTNLSCETGNWLVEIFW